MTVNEKPVEPIGSGPSPQITQPPDSVPPAVFLSLPAKAYAGVPAQFTINVDHGTTWVWVRDHWEGRNAVTFNEMVLDIPGVVLERDHRSTVNSGSTMFVTLPGPGTYTATATGVTTGGAQYSNGPRSFTAQAPPNPTFSLAGPAAGAAVNLGPGGGPVEVHLTSGADQIYPWIVAITRDGVTTSEQYNGTDFRRTINLAATPLGSRTITVTCSDPANRQSTQTRSVVAQDGVPPTVGINPFNGSPLVDTLPFAFVITGTTPGAASGVTGVQYAVDSGPSGPAENTAASGDWSTWRATILLPTTGTFTFTVTATNTRGTTRSAQGTVSPHL